MKTIGRLLENWDIEIVWGVLLAAICGIGLALIGPEPLPEPSPAARVAPIPQAAGAVPALREPLISQSGGL